MATINGLSSPAATNNGSVRAEAILPFYGLGFVMDKLEFHSALLTVRSDPLEVALSRHPVRSEPVWPSGYDLLVRLGREIRGQ